MNRNTYGFINYYKIFIIFYYVIIIDTNFFFFGIYLILSLLVPKKMGIKAVHYLSLNDSFKNSSAVKKLQYELFDSADSDFLQQVFDDLQEVK